jgi:copper(I)-binding protein
MRQLMAQSLVALLWLAGVSMAQADNGIQVKDPWARETPPGVRHGAAYMTLLNEGNVQDRLTGARSDVSNVAELHTHLMEGGVVRMRQIEGVNVPPGTPVVLEPGALHIMLIELKQPLKAGERFPLTLEFERAGDTTVEVEVRKPGD